MSQLVQITRQSGEIRRVPRGEVPVIELQLEDHQYVTSVSLEEINPFLQSNIDRKTVDWKWRAYVVTPLRSVT